MNKDLVNKVEAQEANTTEFLSKEETTEILTPFAFEIDKSLFGIQLASHTRRIFALLVDLFCIALLSDAPGELLAIVVAITFYRLGSKARAEQLGITKGRKRRKIMRAFSAFILFILLLSILPSLIDPFNEPSTNDSPSGVVATSGNELSLTDSIAFSAISAGTISAIAESECTLVHCWHEELKDYVTALDSINVSEDFVEDAVKATAESTELNKAQQQKLVSLLMTDYITARKAYESLIDSRVEDVEVVEVRVDKPDLDEAVTTPEQEQDTSILSPDNAKQDEDSFSIMKYIRGIIEDLGLGFGWAAFYFTVLTSIWGGQTLGKKIFSIRVLQLDGTPLSLWDSFGRYGGYGAGLATGLLGFLQVYWDPNRQAIHDKISNTVVIANK